MALLLKLQNVVEHKTGSPDGTETIEKYDVSVYVTTDTAPDKMLVNKVITIEGGKNAEESKEELKDKIRSWWQKSLAEHNRKINLQAIAQEGIDELLIE